MHRLGTVIIILNISLIVFICSVNAYKILHNKKIIKQYKYYLKICFDKVFKVFMATALALLAIHNGFP